MIRNAGPIVASGSQSQRSTLGSEPGRSDRLGGFGPTRRDARADSRLLRRLPSVQGCSCTPDGRAVWLVSGIALACQNRVENAQTAHPGNVADDVMKVQVHLLQGLLHMLNFGPSRRDQIEPMALQASQPADGVLGPERSTQ